MGVSGCKAVHGSEDHEFREPREGKRFRPGSSVELSARIGGVRLRARGREPLPEWRGSLFYCTVSTQGDVEEVLYQTRSARAPLGEPIWREGLRVKVSRGDSLYIRVWAKPPDADGLSKPHLIGSAVLEAERFDPAGFSGELRLRAVDDAAGVAGYLSDADHHDSDISASQKLRRHSTRSSSAGSASTTSLMVGVSGTASTTSWRSLRSNRSKSSNRSSRSNSSHAPTAHISLRLRTDCPDYPPNNENCFEVDAEVTPKRPLGVVVDGGDGRTLFVTGVKPGPVQEHNKHSVPEHRVRAGDFIMKVNGALGDSSELMRQLKDPQPAKPTSPRRAPKDGSNSPTRGASKEGPGKPKLKKSASRVGAENAMAQSGRGLVRLSVRHAEERHVLLEGNIKGQTGLKFATPASGPALLVTEVGEGPAAAWARECPEGAVREGDRVIAVDGFGGKAADLLKRISSRKKMQLTVIRPACVEDKEGREEL